MAAQTYNEKVELRSFREGFGLFGTAKRAL